MHILNKQFGLLRELDIKLFIQCFQQLVNRYDSLRTIIVQDEQAKPWQAVLYDVQINSEIKKLD